MATYTELYDLRSNSALINKITVAVAVKAQALIDKTTPSVAEINWAKEAIASPTSKAGELLNYLLAKNKASSTSVILQVADDTLQGQVSTAVDVLIAGGV